MSKDQIQNLLVTRIKVRRNVRKTFDEKALNGLLESMKQHGLLEPIRVQSDGEWFVVINGESRLRCAQLLGWETIPGIIDTRHLSECDVLEHQLVENLQRTDLTPLEKAQGIRELMDLRQCSASEAAARLAISNADVTRSLALLRLRRETPNPRNRVFELPP